MKHRLIQKIKKNNKHFTSSSFSLIFIISVDSCENFLGMTTLQRRIEDTKWTVVHICNRWVGWFLFDHFLITFLNVGSYVVVVKSCV